jgi:phosphatidylglycerol:prolipoprotein diacylglycerol transferase
MYPTLLELGPIKLHTYGLMIALGFMAALTLTQRDAKRAGVDPKVIGEMGFIALFLGILGTRVLHIIMFPEDYSWRDPIGWIAVWNGGLVFQGAIPVTFIYVYIAARRRNLPLWTMVDCAAPYLALAQAFGRMGCFFNGCCYGMRADHLPWAIRFPAGSPAYYELPGPEGWSMPVHPSQLYSVGSLLLLCGLLLHLRAAWHPFPGFTMPVYLMLYGAGRFVLEMLRGDGNPTGLGLGYLSDQQVFSIVLAVAGMILFSALYSRANRAPAAPEPANPRKRREKKR